MSVKDFWNEYAEEEIQVFVNELPVGNYTAKVTECKFGKTQNDEDKVQWTLELMNGPDKGKLFGIHRKFSRTDESEENKKNVKRMLNDFKYLGLPCSSGAIKDSMTSIIGKIIDFKVVEGKLGGFFVNFSRIVEPSIPECNVFPEEEIPF